MKQHLRVTALIAATIFSVSVLFLSTGSSSLVSQLSRQASGGTTSQARTPRSSRGATRGEESPDYVKGLSKSLQRNPASQSASFSPQDQAVRIQESKLA